MCLPPYDARVAEPVDARDLGSRAFGREGSSPSSGTWGCARLACLSVLKTVMAVTPSCGFDPYRPRWELELQGAQIGC